MNSIIGLYDIGIKNYQEIYTNFYRVKNNSIDYHLFPWGQKKSLSLDSRKTLMTATSDTATTPSTTSAPDLSELLKAIQFLEQGAYQGFSSRLCEALSAQTFLPFLSTDSLASVPITTAQPSEILNLKRLQLNSAGRSIQTQHAEYIIYGSKQGHDSVQLNGLVLSADGNPIVCRHLSYYVIQSQIKDYHDDLNSVEEIQKITSLMSLDFDRQRKKFLAEHYLFTNKVAFGRALYELSANLKNGEFTNFLLSSHDHMMGLSIKHCDDSYIIKFYDPNFTNRHMRGIFLNRTILQSLRLDAFMPKAMVDYYWNKSSVLTLMSYDKGRYDSRIVVRHLNYDMGKLIVLLHDGIGLDNLSSLMEEKNETQDSIAASAATYCSQSGPSMFTSPRSQLSQVESSRHIPIIKC